MGGAHAEDGGEDGDVGGEGEVVVGYSQGHGQALDRLIAKQAFASTAKEKKRSEAGRDKTEQNGQKERKRKGDQVKISFAVHGMQRKELSLSVIVPSLGSCKTFCHWVPPNKGVDVHIVIVMCAKIKLKNTHVHVITRKQQNMLQPDSY